MLTASTLTYQQEILDDALWYEVQPLLFEHYDEIAHYKDIPLDPDHEGYVHIQAVGMLRIYTARTDTDKLIGYLAVFVTPNLHYRSVKSANQDVLFLHKSHRGSRAGIELIRFAHRSLKAEGVCVLMQHVKARADLNIGPMLGRLLGYERIDEVWGVRLDREA